MGNIPPSAVGQPPPPFDYHRTQDSTIAGNTENQITRPLRYKDFESLADDIVFTILLHLPAQDIHDPAKLVCRKWYRIIHTRYFLHEHVQRSPSGLLFQCVVHKDPIFLAMREGRVAISTIKYKFPCTIWASCNGLILEHGDAKNGSMYITNPATKQRFALPPLRRRLGYQFLASIAYAAASMKYKVVILHNEWGHVLKCAILTVGVDEYWRNVSTQHVSLTAKKLLFSTPLITEGFIHWAKTGSEVLTLNVETEIITETPVPIPRVYVKKKRTRFLSTGRYLTFVIELGNLKWEVWEMKPETGEWRKMPKIIDMEAHKCRFEEKLCDDGIIQPVGWLNYPEVLLFGVKEDITKACFVYKFHTNEIDLIELPEYRLTQNFKVHRNSLLWLAF